jgi:hypothetical protein
MRSPNIINKIIIFGSGFKLGPIAIWDELAIIFRVCVELVSGVAHFKRSIELVVYVYFIMHALHSVVVYTSLISLRLVPMLLALLFSGVMVSRKDESLNGTIILYSMIVFVIPLLGTVFGYEVGWWQDWLFAGTAYAAFSVYVLLTILVQRSNGLSIFLFGVVVMIAIAVTNDSRVSALFAMLIFTHIFFASKKRRIFFVSGLVSILTFSPFIISLALQLNLDMVNFDIIQATYSGVIEGNDSDSDRKEQNASIINFIQDNPFRWIVGNGAYSHQVEMLRYVTPGSTGIVRPTGLPVIFFDYGLIGFVLILFLCMRSAKKLFGYGRNLLESIYLSLMPVICLASLAITNLFDMVLFWIVINGEVTKHFMEPNHLKA